MRLLLFSRGTHPHPKGTSRIQRLEEMKKTNAARVNCSVAGPSTVGRAGCWRMPVRTKTAIIVCMCTTCTCAWYYYTMYSDTCYYMTDMAH
eukprot:gene18974-biopygen20489